MISNKGYQDKDTDSDNDSPPVDQEHKSPEHWVDIGMGEESGSSNQDANQEDDYPYEVLSGEDILQHMLKAIEDVNNVIHISSAKVRILLNHFKWDTEKLLEKIYSDEQEQIFKDAKVINPFRTTPLQKIESISNQSPEDQTSECEFCCRTLPKSGMTGLECGHMYCRSCWTDYLTTKIMDDGASLTIECPGNCDILVDDIKVIELVKDPTVRLKYQHLITNSYVQCNRLVKWCPAPDCTMAIKVHHIAARPVKCRCGHEFCFFCTEAWHDPVRCYFIQKWIKKCDDDSETSNWISANTKECPKCKATIEKDGGCNHVICKNQSCKADFCWVCLGPWEPHGSSWYNCNRYDENEARNARNEQERSRAALQRYLFYCNRYMNHLQSLKFEHKLYGMVKDKMEEMQQHNMAWIDVQFLKKAVDVLCECRRTLMYTYAFAFYLKTNNHSVMFEDNQKDLQAATEQLSEYLEREISAENLPDIKQKVLDKYRYCDSRRKVLLDNVHEGYDKGWWEYTEPDQ